MNKKARLYKRKIMWSLIWEYIARLNALKDLSFKIDIIRYMWVMVASSSIDKSAILRG